LVKKLLAALALVLLTATGSLGISDHGDPTVTRLYGEDRFVCTVSYIHPYISQYMSWVVTAGHCANAGGTQLRRNHQTNTIAVINWRALTLGDPRYTEGFNDLAIGTAPDVRDGSHTKYFLAETMPKRGGVYVHGFPAGVENVTVAYILPEASVHIPGSTLLAVKAGTIVGGSSGSPVLDDSGRLVGILWGIVSEDNVPNLGLPRTLKSGYDIALVTPVERLHELMKLIGVKNG
jgi:hypothetical protein